jgi:3-phosphoshikimate 1-carboxyvinyltransferase
LRKINARIEDLGNGNYALHPDFKILENSFETYKDHRMAMAFAPLGLKGKVDINDPQVVSKSYPEFWDHLKAAGFSIF